MRIVAGEFKGRRLAGPPSDRVRPTSDKVREALFSILGDIGGVSVLDLFAGTGALALEALSRGAKSAVLVERDRAVARVAERNIDDVLGEAAGRARLVRSDVRSFLSGSGEGSYGLVLIDPPYAELVDFAEVIAAELPRLLVPGARVVIESDRRTQLVLPECGLSSRSEHRYGDTLLRIFDAP